MSWGEKGAEGRLGTPGNYTITQANVGSVPWDEPRPGAGAHSWSPPVFFVKVSRMAPG